MFRLPHSVALTGHERNRWFRWLPPAKQQSMLRLQLGTSTKCAVAKSGARTASLVRYAV
jgi:hypothetical protein